MRKIYLAVFIIFITSVLLFAWSLVYLHQEKHKVYYFTTNLDGHDVGTVKVDRYVTDDMLIYASAASVPFSPIFTESKSRITLDRRYNLMSYAKEKSGAGARETTYIEKTGKNISFVATSNSEFARLSDLPVRQETFVFEEDSPVTYLAILENYNFKIGRAQAFSVITCYPAPLPPMKRILTLTSIKDEYIMMGSKKIKAECLLIKIKNSPQGKLWVAKSGRSLVAIEFPERKLKITRAITPPKTLTAEKMTLKDDLYVEEKVKFNIKKAALSGTLTIPKKELERPAVLLIGGSGGGDRENQGLFTYIADYLGKEGYLVLRFDRRGIGSSAGDAGSATVDDELEDANAALEYILSRKEADPQRIAVIGHGKGAFLASTLASETKKVNALILIAPRISFGGETDLNFDSLNAMAAKLRWNDKYLKLAMKSRMETIDIVKRTKDKWTTLLGAKCFLKKLRDELEEKPIDIIRKVESPVLILHGKEDEMVSAKSSSMLDKILEESYNKNHKLIFYGYLGHFFGKRINDGMHRTYYEADKNVLDAIKKWLDASMPKIDLTLQKNYDILPINKIEKEVNK